MPKRIAILVTVAVTMTLLVWGSAVGNNISVKQSSASSDRLGDGSWIFKIDRSWSRPQKIPRYGIQLSEAEYRPISKGPTYHIVVSDGGSRVEIDGAQRLAVRPPMKGSRSMSGDRTVYDLQEGVFAGGQFVVWSGTNGLQAELTIYGSGVPIITSERGALQKKR